LRSGEWDRFVANGLRGILWLGELQDKAFSKTFFHLATRTWLTADSKTPHCADCDFPRVHQLAGAKNSRTQHSRMRVIHLAVRGRVCGLQTASGRKCDNPGLPPAQSAHLASFRIRTEHQRM